MRLMHQVDCDEVVGEDTGVGPEATGVGLGVALGLRLGVGVIVGDGVGDGDGPLVFVGDGSES